MMKSRTTSRYAVFLILLVLGQEFCVARYAAQSKSRSTIKKKEEDEHKYEEKTVHSAIAKRTRKKRNVGAIISTISSLVALIVQGAGLNFEIYLLLKGCCGLYPSACEARDEFIRINKTMIYPIAKQINNLVLKVELFKEDVLSANWKLGEIWLELKRIGEYELKIVEMLPNKTKEQIIRKMHELKTEMTKNNQTMQTLKSLDIDTKYKSVFNNLAANIAIAMLPMVITILMTFAPEIWSAIKELYYQGKVDVVTAASKNVKSKWTIANNVVSTCMSVAAIGYEIYSAVTKVLQCKKVRDKVKKARDSIETAADEMVQTKAKVQDFYNFLNNEGWKFITDQLTNDTFLNSLREMKLLAENAAEQSQELQSAAKTLQHFLKNINGSKDDAGTVINLQKDLVKALGSIKFLLKCYYNRLKLLAYVERECKKGHGSLSKIFKQAKASFEVRHVHCESKGIPYATHASLREAINETAEEEGWNLDCRLNNNVTANTVCRKYKCDKKKASTVAQEMGLTVDQVNYFLLQNCSNVVRDTLTPAEKSRICTLRNSLRGFLPTDKVNGIIKSNLGECVKPSAINDYKCRPTQDNKTDLRAEPGFTNHT